MPKKIGNPRACRAVGGANNKNPVVIAVPCHRVVGTDGSLTGYAGGLDIKEMLLNIEKNNCLKYAVGADIGGTSVKIGIFTEYGELVANTEIPTRCANGYDLVIENTAERINTFLAENNIEKASVKGIGAGIPGPVADGVVKHCVNLLWENSVDVSAKLEKLTGIKSCVLNDANAAALGELWMGGGKGHSDMVLATLGTGIGGGIVIDNNVVVGADGAGGEIGHITVEYENGRQCNCGKKGCLETYASATGIVRTAKEFLENSSEKSLLRGSEVTAKAVFDAAKTGDKIALEVVESFGKYLGRALANIAAVVNPEIIVLAGGVVKAGEMVNKTVEKHFRENAFKTVKNTKIALATLENDAGIYGAAREALKL